jgi:hypothetical protein
MSPSENPKRHRPSQKKIELDVYFLPDRLPSSLQHPLDKSGRPGALIKIVGAEGHLSPTSGGTKSFQITLTVGAPGEGHFMGIDLSVPDARTLRDALDYVIAWQEDLNARGRAAPQPGPKGKRAARGRS